MENFRETAGALALERGEVMLPQPGDNRRPAMVEALKELEKAVGMVSATTMEIYTCLGLTTSPPRPKGRKRQKF